MRLIIPAAILTSTALLGSCRYIASAPIEVVMCPGDVIEYRTSGGQSLRIVARSEIERQYVIGGSLQFTVKLTPRNSRWYGSLGIYRDHGVGNTHMVLEEAIQHFSSTKEANEWLKSRDRTIYGWMAAIDETGLFVTWRYDARPPGHTGGPDYALSVDIYQILVNLDKPRDLGTPSDDRITKNLSSSCDAKALEHGYVPSNPAELHGRMYSGRALDHMREQGYDGGDVERLIGNATRHEHGARAQQDGTDTLYLSKPFDRPSYVRMDATGRIVSVQ
jgi:hypothetical protein